MNSGVIKALSLESLPETVPVVTADAAGFYRENCIVCFDCNGHRSGVRLTVDYADSQLVYTIHWLGDVTNELRRNYGDLQRATDFAACAIALLLVPELTGLTAIRQASIGTTIDYYLAPQSQDDVLLFNDTARLEVSGILKENPSNTVDRRVKTKLRRLKPDRGLPAFVVVVEFSRPWSRMVKHG